MNVTVNQKDIALPDNATVADLVAQMQARPPFAVAVNLQFVPNTRYAQHALAAGDAVEIISPVTGG
ncbi:sulfur carrier protein ThiS [Diaphorobacter ruginosibacter]|uniref:Sulfur carrier protein ThiS n=1 Tax=Diaphorobacter ruginosibacter TaxID=1715720 RepID=A0A7G9RIS8_9BURK|nr:sulfur carrier protein ThiS [Diaphorobacter ruginosibacter]QNN55503.1 sulfur carrier protein ThiS [Diaphorobacter ruginosibacter]